MALAGLVLIGLAVHGDSRGNPVDDAIARWIARDVGGTAAGDLLHLTDPWVDVAVSAAAALWAAWRRWWRAVVLAVVSVPLALTLAELVVKPAVDRSNVIVTHGLGLAVLAYPSGHETGLTAALAVVGVLAVARGRRRWTGPATVAALLAVAVAAGIGLVGEFYHYASDVLGAVLLVTGTTLGAALAVDGAGDRLAARTAERRTAVSSPGVPGPPRRARGA